MHLVVKVEVPFVWWSGIVFGGGDGGARRLGLYDLLAGYRLVDQLP